MGYDNPPSWSINKANTAIKNYKRLINLNYPMTPMLEIENFRRMVMGWLSEFEDNMMCIALDAMADGSTGKDQSYVYFIRIKGTNRVKIGKSDNPVRRLKGLQTGCPFALELVKTIQCKDSNMAFNIERSLHMYFEKNQVKVDNGSRRKTRTEWFFIDDKVFENFDNSYLGREVKKDLERYDG